MAIDWNVALGSMDQSLEAMLARRDVTRLQNMLLNVEKEAEQRRQFEADQDYRTKSLAETMALRKAQQDALLENRRQLEESRRTDDERSKFNLLKPGDVVSAEDFKTHSKYAPANAFTEDDQLGGFVYRRQEAEREAAEALRKENNERERLKLAEEANRRAEQAAARAEKEQQRRDRDEKRRVDVHNKKMADLNKKLDEVVPVHLRPQFNKAVEDEMKSSIFDIGDWFGEAQAREAAIDAVYKKWEKQGLIKPTAIPPANPKDFTETPQQKRDRLLKEAGIS